MILPFLGALLIGTSLGLMGSGGSILTVPVLMYLVGQEEKVAIAGALWVVGVIALVSGARAARARHVDWNSVLWFGLPGMLGTYLGAMLGGVVSGNVQIWTFIVVMTLAGIWMLKPRRAVPPCGPPSGTPTTRAPARIVIDGLMVGALTGFVGVGGGFLIVPALVLLGGLTMQRAVASSLIIIAMNSFTGFVKHHHVIEGLHQHLDWAFLAIFASVGVVGSLLGGFFGARINQNKLRKIFAIVLLVTAASMSAERVHGMMRGPAVHAGAR